MHVWMIHDTALDDKVHCPSDKQKRTTQNIFQRVTIFAFTEFSCKCMSQRAVSDIDNGKG
jgi:hypothetical protein